MNSIGKRINNLRKAKKMSQVELAQRLGITGSAISSYENNIRLPSYETLIQISRILNVSTDNLLGISAEITLDVTNLTDEQRDIISSIIATYKNYNAVIKNPPG